MSKLFETERPHREHTASGFASVRTARDPSLIASDMAVFSTGKDFEDGREWSPSGGHLSEMHGV
jgi:hypothetical protein